MEIGKAIKAINPNARYTYSDEDFDSIKWLYGTTPIPKAEIESKMIELQVEYDAQEYARNRQAEYPDWGTQLNKIYDDGVTKWKSEMVDPIKAKWPKDNSGPK